MPTSAGSSLHTSPLLGHQGDSAPARSPDTTSSPHAEENHESELRNSVPTTPYKREKSVLADGSQTSAVRTPKEYTPKKNAGTGINGDKSDGVPSSANSYKTARSATSAGGSFTLPASKIADKRTFEDLAMKDQEIQGLKLKANKHSQCRDEDHTNDFQISQLENQCRDNEEELVRRARLISLQRDENIKAQRGDNVKKCECATTRGEQISGSGGDRQGKNGSIGTSCGNRRRGSSISRNGLCNTCQSTELELAVKQQRKELMDLESSNRRLTSMRTELESCIDTLRNDETTLKTRLVGSRRQLDAVKSQIEQLNQEKQALVTSLETCRTEVAANEERRSQLTADVSSLETDVKIRSESISKAKSELEQLQTKLRDLEVAITSRQNELQTVTDHVKKKDSELTKLKASCKGEAERLEQLNEELASKSLDLAERESSLVSKKAVLQQTSVELKDGETKLARQRSEMGNLRAEWESITLKRSEAKEALAVMENQMADKKKQIDLLKTEHSSLSTVMDQLRITKADLDQSIAEKSLQIHTFHDNWSKRTKEIEELRSRIEGMKKTSSRLQKQITQKQHQYDELEVKTKEIMEQEQLIRGRVESYEQRKVDMAPLGVQCDNTAYEQECEQYQKRLELLKANVRDMEQRELEAKKDIAESEARVSEVDFQYQLILKSCNELQRYLESISDSVVVRSLGKSKALVASRTNGDQANPDFTAGDDSTTLRPWSSVPVIEDVSTVNQDFEQTLKMLKAFQEGLDLAATDNPSGRPDRTSGDEKADNGTDSPHHIQEETSDGPPKLGLCQKIHMNHTLHILEEREKELQAHIDEKEQQLKSLAEEMTLKTVQWQDETTRSQEEAENLTAEAKEKLAQLEAATQLAREELQLMRKEREVEESRRDQWNSTFASLQEEERKLHLLRGDIATAQHHLEVMEEKLVRATNAYESMKYKVAFRKTESAFLRAPKQPDNYGLGDGTTTGPRVFENPIMFESQYPSYDSEAMPISAQMSFNRRNLHPASSHNSVQYGPSTSGILSTPPYQYTVAPHEPAIVSSNSSLINANHSNQSLPATPTSFKAMIPAKGLPLVSWEFNARTGQQPVLLDTEGSENYPCKNGGEVKNLPEAKDSPVNNEKLMYGENVTQRSPKTEDLRDRSWQRSFYARAAKPGSELLWTFHGNHLPENPMGAGSSLPGPYVSRRATIDQPSLWKTLNPSDSMLSSVGADRRRLSLDEFMGQDMLGVDDSGLKYSKVIDEDMTTAPREESTSLFEGTRSNCSTSEAAAGPMCNNGTDFPSHVGHQTTVTDLGDGFYGEA